MRYLKKLLVNFVFEQKWMGLSEMRANGVVVSVDQRVVRRAL